MEKKEPITNTDAVEITRIDTFSLVKMFTGIISGIAIFLSFCALIFYYFIIRGNMIFLPEAYAGFFQFFTIPAIIGWLVAVIVISCIGGLFLAGMYNPKLRLEIRVHIPILHVFSYLTEMKAIAPKDLYRCNP